MALGYTVKDACDAVGISRSGYYVQSFVRGDNKIVPEVKDLDLLERISGIKSGHPCLRQAGLLGVVSGEGMVGASGEGPGQREAGP